MKPAFNTTAYRYPNETVVLLLTILLVLGIIALTATATACLSIVFIAGMVGYSYYLSQQHHQALLRQADQVTRQENPELFRLLQENRARLQVEPVVVFIASNRELNAYTFGLSQPKSIVLNAGLFQVMDRNEIQFILGHEMGHVRLGHTWLNSLVGGMAGIPAPYEAALLMVLILRSWNRTCEYSADRAGLLACGNLNKAITALIKLEAGPSGLNQAGLQLAYQRIEAEDDDLTNNLMELLGTHPMIIKRIDQLKRYAASAQFRQLYERMNQNLSNLESM